MKSPGRAPWWLVYGELTLALVSHYDIYKEKAGTELLFKLLSNKRFLEYNKWAHSFLDNDTATGLDPMHLFASINGSRASDSLRINRINVLLDSLEAKLRYEDIDFEGCPALVTMAILSPRDKKSVQEIWSDFHSISFQFRTEEYINMFQVKSWYGIDITAYTVFLFWVNSFEFLSLDKNTLSFLVDRRILHSSKVTPREYDEIVRTIKEHDIKPHPIYGENGLFREIVAISYIVRNSNTFPSISSNFKGFLDAYDSHYYEDLLDVPLQIEDISIEPEIPATSTIESDITFPDKPKKQKQPIPSLGSGLRIFAVKPLARCAKEYLNILKPGQTYYFEKCFAIEGKRITYHKEKDVSLYDLRQGKEHLNVNVTTIVGKNGSGKSSLVELIFRMVNNLCYSLRKDLNKQKFKKLDKLAAELYYVANGSIHCLRVNYNNVRLYQYRFEDSQFIQDPEPKKFEMGDLRYFFYTIAVSYSHYSLNSRYIGTWIDELFHKNDSYQTPLVINPMRTQGNIDINRENELVTQRLVANLFEPLQDDYLGIRQLTPTHLAHEVVFLFKERSYSEDTLILYNKDYLGEYVLNSIYFIFEIERDDFYGTYIPEQDRTIIEEVKLYLFYKLEKIATTYPQYTQYLKEGYEGITSASLYTLLRAIKRDSSHVVYKFKQTINYLKYDLIPKEEYLQFGLDELSHKKKSHQISQKELQDIPLIELLPPPFYDITIKIINKDTQEISDFNRLSSGEKQQIYAITSIIYHLNNLDSITGNRLINYKNIYLLLDEIDLYYHPEMQRQYLSYLLKTLEKMSFRFIQSINICLVTHSPYILSDIPNVFTLRLRDGLRIDEPYKTFGANIHDLLANEFFMEYGFMGQWAKEKIEETIAFLNHTKIERELKNPPEGMDEQTHKEKQEELNHLKTKIKTQELPYYKEIIKLIGEPIIQYKLQDMYNELFVDNPEKEHAEREIREIAKKAGIDLKSLN